MAGTHTAFFYGTLMAPEVLYRVCYGASTITSAHPSHAAMKALTIAPAILQGFGRYKVQHADYPGMVASPGHSVRGTLVTGLTDRDIGRLDLFEGSEYDRVKVVVKTLEEEKDVEAATYVFKHVSYLEKEEWSYEEFRKQKMHRWADASEEYKDVDLKDKIDSTQATPDPTGGRGISAARNAQSNDAQVKEEEVLLKSAV